ncbi:hypothetical protein FRC06_002190 [Ceratobasidium sp. 370]|nr:hypothetical protein FRC06_002190 [Ceratobasidium sp. 370]
MFASRMLLRVPGRTQTLHLNSQLRSFSLTRIALDPPKKAAPPPLPPSPPPPPPPPAPAPKRAIKAAPVEPEKIIRKPRLVLSDKERGLAAKEKAREKTRAKAAMEKERQRAAREKLKLKEKAAAVKQREKERQLAKKQKDKEHELAKKQKAKERELAKKEREKEKERKKAEKPYPPPPKRPMTPYFFFARELKSEPGASVTQAAIEASEAWKALPDSEKQVYVKKYEEAQAKYKADVADWIASLNYGQLAVARFNREPGTRDEAAMERLPKRPGNSFALFMKDMMTHPGMNKKIDAAAEKEAKGDPDKINRLKLGIRGRLAAAEWKTLSDKDKQVYEAKAADLKAAWDKDFGITIAQQKAARLSAAA